MLSELYGGLVLGSRDLVGQLRRRLAGQRDREKPQLQALQASRSLPERLAEYARRLGLETRQLAELLRPVRHQERPLRDALMYLLWHEGRFRLGQIASHFGLGYSAVSTVFYARRSCSSVCPVIHAGDLALHHALSAIYFSMHRGKRCWSWDPKERDTPGNSLGLRFENERGE